MRHENRMLGSERVSGSRFRWNDGFPIMARGSLSRRNDGGCLKRRTLVGASTVEYALCALLAVLVLFTPYDGDQSVVDKFMEAIRDAHAAQVHAIGNPVVGSSVTFINQNK